MLGGEHEGEASLGLCSQPSLGFFGDVRRVIVGIVENELDRRAGRDDKRGSGSKAPYQGRAAVRLKTLGTLAYLAESSGRGLLLRLSFTTILAKLGFVNDEVLRTRGQACLGRRS